HRRRAQHQGAGLLPAGRAEYAHGAQICPLRLCAGERPRGARRRCQSAERESGRQGVLSRHRGRKAQIVPRGEALSSPQALAGVSFNRPIIFWIALVLVLVSAIALLREVLLPFITGMVLAYLLDPLARRMERLGMNRLLATLVIITLV